MRKMFVTAVVVLFAVGWAGAGEVRIVLEPAGEGGGADGLTHHLVREPAATPIQAANTSYKAWVPFFVVDTTDPEGVNTLFAVRNRGTSTVTVDFRYYDAGWGSPVTETRTLAPRETRTVSVRDVPGIPTDPGTGLKTGIVEIEEQTMSGELAGDWFRVDSANNFAGGDRLVSFDSFCYAWDARFFSGGPFSGGTIFTFMLGSNLTDGTSPIVVGQVYDEAGTHRGTVQVYTADQVFEVGTQDLPAGILGASGTIEWTIQNPYNGFVLTTFSALGKYTASLPAMCVDNAVGSQ